MFDFGVYKVLIRVYAEGYNFYFGVLKYPQVLSMTYFILTLRCDSNIATVRGDSNIATVRLIVSFREVFLSIYFESLYY
jgi:hypothetical protein